MKKIIIRANHSEMINQVSALTKVLFPECDVFVISAKKNYGDLNPVKTFLEKNIGNKEPPHCDIYQFLSKAK